MFCIASVTTLEALNVYTNLPQNRHSGRDSLRPILPGAVRVNANPFQTDFFLTR